MNPLQLLEKYYQPNSDRFRILVEHSRAVTDRALIIGERLSADRVFLEEAGMLHDIGVFAVKAPGIDCHGDQPYLCHGIIGRELLEKEGLWAHALVCERHVGTGLTAEQIEQNQLPLPARDMRPRLLEEEILSYADLFYSKKSGPLEPDQVRLKLARHGPEEVAVYDAWRARFEPEGIV